MKPPNAAQAPDSACVVSDAAAAAQDATADNDSPIRGPAATAQRNRYYEHTYGGDWPEDP